jgi:hypothetical protein
MKEEEGGRRKAGLRKERIYSGAHTTEEEKNRKVEDTRKAVLK